MKLYIWNNPYGVNYGGSIAYAIASDEDEARALVKGARRSHFGHSPDEEVGKYADVDGAPTRVCELPYAEIYEWSE